MKKIKYTLRSQSLKYDENGSRYWHIDETEAEYAPGETAVIIVDMWDKHWSAGATRRVAELAPKIDAAVRRCREKGMLIIHAPSGCWVFYDEHPARERVLEIDRVELPEIVELLEYPQPVDSKGGGSDTEDEYPENTGVWSRQHEAIFIDDGLDLISDNGEEIYAHFLERGIKFVIYMGVHTNMCVLGRSFAIKAMRRAGLKTALVRDLTDAMYDPVRPPYVSHKEGTRLVVEYIEKFYSPTISNEQL